MKYLYDDLSQQCSKITTKQYSTSFSFGILCLDQRLRNGIYGIYGFVRLADEIVDSFHDYDKKLLLDQFEADTYNAIKNKISLNPILNSFQNAVHQYNIEIELIKTFLKSMRMDLEQIQYNSSLYKEYI